MIDIRGQPQRFIMNPQEAPNVQLMKVFQCCQRGWRVMSIRKMTSPGDSTANCKRSFPPPTASLSLFPSVKWGLTPILLLLIAAWQQSHYTSTGAPSWRQWNLSFSLFLCLYPITCPVHPPHHPQFNILSTHVSSPHNFPSTYNYFYFIFHRLKRLAQDVSCFTVHSQCSCAGGRMSDQDWLLLVSIKKM